MSTSDESVQAATIRLWELPCRAIKVFLTYGMRPDTLRALVQGSLCGPCAARLDDDAWVLHKVHQACHSPNQLSNRIEAQLHVRFREQIEFVRSASYPALVQQLAVEGTNQFRLVGLLWALHTNASPAKRQFGNSLLSAMVFDVEPAAPANVIPWPGKLHPVRPRTDRHRWN